MWSEKWLLWAAATDSGGGGGGGIRPERRGLQPRTRDFTEEGPYLCDVVKGFGNKTEGGGGRRDGTKEREEPKMKPKLGGCGQRCESAGGRVFASWGT